ncbi:SDR family oxidoreductase [Pseudomonas aeruginosa]|uniref:SDR family oxidoreductase n=1 Tax=Pseudomonas aeruginosa TaxID=287 RepID=UPI003C6E26AD
MHTSIEHSRDWCRSLLILNCQELAAQQPLRPINWCSRLLKMTMAALTHLKKAEAGRIINIAAGAASKASLGMGAYAAAKSGVMRLTEALAEELKDQRITVNAIMPSIIDTPQNRLDMPDADATRWVTPEQVANVIVFLASQEASAITGAAIAVNGRC